MYLNRTRCYDDFASYLLFDFDELVKLSGCGTFWPFKLLVSKSFSATITSLARLGPRLKQER